MKILPDILKLLHTERRDSANLICPLTNFCYGNTRHEYVLSKAANEENHGNLHEVVKLRGPLGDRKVDASVPC
jgi:hypothetical protein